MIELIRHRVEELAALDPQCTLFGASAHRYRFNPPYPEAELAQFERAHGFTLPDDYRTFITRLGNGGVGPSYGMIPFRGRDSEDHTVYEKLGSSFAYSDAYNSEDVDAFDAAGALYLSHHGCAWYSMLIVSGPCRSQVWTDDVASDGGFLPEAAPETGARLTFTSWYMAWLDRAFHELGAP